MPSLVKPSGTRPGTGAGTGSGLDPEPGTGSAICGDSKVLRWLGELSKVPSSKQRKGKGKIGWYRAYMLYIYML